MIVCCLTLLLDVQLSVSVNKKRKETEERCLRVPINLFCAVCAITVNTCGVNLKYK